MGSVLGSWGSSALAVLCSAFTLTLVLWQYFPWDGGYSGYASFPGGKFSVKSEDVG
jgi:hypothetical protein